MLTHQHANTGMAKEEKNENVPPIFCCLLCECIVSSKFRGLVITWSKVKDGPLCPGIRGAGGGGGEGLSSFLGQEIFSSP